MEIIMDNTIYAAASGMLARQRSMNAISNNLANMETNGYKRSKVMLEKFGEYLTMKTDDNRIIGSKTHGVFAGSTYTDFEQGHIIHTGRKLDFAIDGSGFFTVITEEGETFLTRDGHFNIDDNGFLMDKNGCFLVGQNGIINLREGDFSVSEQGAIITDGVVTDMLRITVPENSDGLEVMANGLIELPNIPLIEFTGRIVRGSIEKANVCITDEMAAMISESRAFQSCSQMLKIADQIMQKTVNEIARV